MLNKESDSIMTLNRIFPDIGIMVITLLDWDRDVAKTFASPKIF